MVGLACGRQMEVTMWAKLGRCKGAARGALQVAAQRPAYSVQVPENIGCCMQRCRALQRSGSTSHGASPQPSVMGDGASVANLRAAASWVLSAAWWLCPTGTNPGAGAGTDATAPAGPRTKKRKIRATLRLQLAHYGLWRCACSRSAPYSSCFLGQLSRPLAGFHGQGPGLFVGL